MDWDRLLADCVDFAQRIIQTPSMPREEAAVAELISGEMRRLNFDEVWLDEIGNVNGRIFGQDRELGALVLNSHMDHVDPGDPDLWPVPPFSAEIVDGRILGRAACDIKGPLAVQVYSMAALLREGGRPRRDIVFSGVVQEEIGGVGARHWIDHLDYPVSLVVLGEPSDNNVALGHRGGLWIWLTFNGRSVHASVPDKGINPNYAMAQFLTRLEEASLELGSHPVLGPTSVAPTIVEVDTASPNVTPAWTRVTLDFRTATESVDSLVDFIQRVAGEFPHSISNGHSGEPFSSSDDTITGFYTPPESDVVQRAQELIGRGMGRQPELTSYQFATDGRFFTRFPIIGYSPGEEPLAHTVRESISIAKMGDSLRSHVSLLRHF
jgi:putative selenium metabolism hydrolase